MYYKYDLPVGVGVCAGVAVIGVVDAAANDNINS